MSSAVVTRFALRGVCETFGRVAGRRFMVAALAWLVLFAPPHVFAAADSPKVSGPIGGAAKIAFGVDYELAKVGYEEAEFILTGAAHSYSPSTPLTAEQHGRWATAPDAAVGPYTTRIVVWRPIDPRRFNGTVWVEWLNNSGGQDSALDWALIHNELVREGAAWVGVTNQAAGVNALRNLPFGDPTRYASLSHPGNKYAFDIFSQAAQAVADNPMLVLKASTGSAKQSGARPVRLIGIAISSGASDLVTYVDGVHGHSRVFHGYLVHSRIGAVPALQDGASAVGAVPNPVPVRDDLDVPVLVIQSQSDVLNFVATRQPDSAKIRWWEVAGAAHYDYYGVATAHVDTGAGEGAVQSLESMLKPTGVILPGRAECTIPINTGPMHWVLNAGVHALDKWVREGTAPPIAPRLEMASMSPATFATDAFGNVKGGVRTPHVDAPIATLTGNGNPVFTDKPLTFACGLFGQTIPFTSARLSELYKSQDDFVSKWKASAQAAVKAGFLVPADAKELTDAAVRTSIGGR